MKFIIKFLMFIGILLVVLSIIGLFLVNRKQEETFTNMEPVNVLFIGSDAGGSRGMDEGVRSDSLILASFTPNGVSQGIETAFLSIPRDTLAPIACQNNEPDKITHAMYDGYLKNSSIEDGIDCTVETVENLVNVPIEYYVYIDFDSFINLIDQVGGIEIDVSYPFCEQDSNGTADAICFDEGVNQMDGEAALAYARQRYYSSDYERALRQQQVILATFYELIDSIKTNPTSTINSLINSVTTNIGASTLLNWSNFLINYSEKIKENIAYGNILNIILIDTTDYSIRQTNPENENYNYTTLEEIYSAYSGFNKDTNAYNYIIDKSMTKIPTQKAPENYEPATYYVQFQSVVLDVYDNMINNTYYSEAYPDSLNEISNVIRQILNLDYENIN